jgi:hypothetical protein
MTDHATDTFEVVTIQETKEYPIATRYETVFNEFGPNFLMVFGNDDFEDGQIRLRVFNLDHVVDYGWK